MRASISPYTSTRWLGGIGADLDADAMIEGDRCGLCCTVVESGRWA